MRVQGCCVHYRVSGVAADAAARTVICEFGDGRGTSGEQLCGGTGGRGGGVSAARADCAEAGRSGGQAGSEDAAAERNILLDRPADAEALSAAREPGDVP